MSRNEPPANLQGEVLLPEKKAMKLSRQERAQECTEYLQAFEAAISDWAELGTRILEVEKDELYLELGCSSLDDWLHKFAPVSYRKAMDAKKLVKRLCDIPLEEMRQIPPETAKYAMVHVSAKLREQPEIREALKLSRKKAVEALKIAAPSQHFEDVKKRMLKFSESQHEIVDDGYEAYKFAQSDEKVLFEDFIEFLVNNWLDSAGENGKTLRENWELHKAELVAREIGAK
jgi:hypothetical protein